MAVGTAAAMMGVGLATSGYSIFKGAKQNREAKNALNNLETPELTNVYENLPISTLGSNLMREESSRTTASVVDASRNSGIRGVFGAIPKIQAQSNSQNQQAQLYLDNQINQRNQRIASDNQRIQQMNEARYNNELAGIGQQMNVAQKYIDQGIGGAANSLMYGISNGVFSKKEE